MSVHLVYAGVCVAIIALLTITTQRYWEDHAKFALGIKLDTVIVVAIVILSFASIELHKVKEEAFSGFTVGSLDQAAIEQINGLDQTAAGRWDIVAKDKGKLFKNTAIYIIPLSLLLFLGSIKGRLVLFFIFSQGYMLTEILTGLTKALVDRYRPFAYMSTSGLESLGQEAGEEFREDIVEYDILNSFFSGDASVLAYGFVFFALAFSVYRNRTTRLVVWIAAFAAIAAGCYFRTMSGKHFPSDVIVGAVVGAMVAALILWLHFKPKDSDLT